MRVRVCPNMSYRVGIVPTSGWPDAVGRIPMEDMDLVVDPRRRRLTVDPANPNLPHARVK